MASQIFTINYKQTMKASGDGHVTWIDELKLPKMHDMESGKRIVTEILGYTVQWSGDYKNGVTPKLRTSHAGVAGLLLLNPKTEAQILAGTSAHDAALGDAIVVGQTDVIDTFQISSHQVPQPAANEMTNRRTGSQGTIFRQLAPYGKGFDVLQDSIYIAFNQENGKQDHQTTLGIRLYCRQRLVSAKALNAMVVARMQAD